MNKQIRSRILLRAAKLSGLSDSVVWTESGLTELGNYNYELYKDVDGGPINFIAGAMATLHKVNGPHFVEV